MSENIDTLDHIKEILHEREKALKDLLCEREKSLDLTAKNLEVRLAHLNALRDQVLEDRVNFVNRDVFNEAVRRIDTLEKWQAKVVGVAAVLVLMSGMLGAVIANLLRGT